MDRKQDEQVGTYGKDAYAHEGELEVVSFRGLGVAHLWVR